MGQDTKTDTGPEANRISKFGQANSGGARCSLVCTTGHPNTRSPSPVTLAY